MLARRALRIRRLPPIPACRLRIHDFSVGSRPDFTSNLPPHLPLQDQSSSEKGKGKAPSDNGEEPISDQEWELRTGRGLFVLRNTLPEFFTRGLVTHVEEDQIGPKSDESSGCIYSHNIRLSYTPPSPLPPPFPRTLQVEGLALYQASAVFVRHTLGAFYTDLGVGLERVNMVVKGRREREVSVRMAVEGIGRVSGARTEWIVCSTYAFSPISGLIYRHTVESIDPAPHLTVYDALRMTIARLAGHGVTNSSLTERTIGDAHPCTASKDPPR